MSTSVLSLQLFSYQEPDRPVDVEYLYGVNTHLLNHQLISRKVVVSEMGFPARLTVDFRLYSLDLKLTVSLRLFVPGW